jgi:hypothetical protein
VIHFEAGFGTNSPKRWVKLLQIYKFIVLSPLVAPFSSFVWTATSFICTWRIEDVTRFSSEHWLLHCEICIRTTTRGIKFCAYNLHWPLFNFF